VACGQLKSHAVRAKEALAPRTEGEEAMAREYFKGEREQQRSYSRAVKVKGGTTVYLAGIGAPTDPQGNSLAGNFTAQTHRVFERLRETMALVGGTLDDIVTMTVFITDPRYGDEFVAIRQQYFTRGFPGSALISVHSLARPEMLVEVQAIAVLDA
jgi:2-iminobutanoate/2-iminopropanoate deaminase